LELARDVVRVVGPDAERYLQGQLSQDVVSLAVGGCAWSLVLQPQGKLDAFLRVYRFAPDEFLLDTDAGVGGVLVARLLRFRLRTKAEIVPVDWRVVAVRGTSAPAPASCPDGTAVVVPFEWNALRGYDLIGPSPSVPKGATAVDLAAYEIVRIEAGFPRHGAELDERIIPAEAGLVGAAVSFTKGCYTGQELVARIDSRGNNVPRRLCGLVLAGPVEPDALLYPLPGAQDGPGAEPRKEVGRLTSVACSPGLGWVGLGFVARSVGLGQTLSAGAGENAVPAQVRPLPLVATVPSGGTVPSDTPAP
jgi:folate-binding protein YgfZ